MRVHLCPQALALEWREDLQSLHSLFLRAGRLADRLPETILLRLRFREDRDAPGVCLHESSSQFLRRRDLVLGEVVPSPVVTLEPYLRRHGIREHLRQTGPVLEAVLESQHRLCAVASKHAIDVVAKPLVALAAHLLRERDDVPLKLAERLRDHVLPGEPARRFRTLAVDAGRHPRKVDGRGGYRAERYGS